MYNLDLETAYHAITWMWLLTPFVIVPLLRYVPAPYGKFTRGNWGLMIDGRFGFFFQEIFSLIAYVLTFYYLAPAHPSLLQQALFLMFNIHYFNRSIIYTLRSPGMKQTTISVVAMAAGFTTANGFINGYAAAKLVTGPLTSVSAVIGIAVFIYGMYVNGAADSHLMDLRRGKDTKEYYIPTSGMFQFVSCANYFGEIIEWIGYAIATNFNLAAVSFVVMTLANLVPRSLTTHKWYQDKFKEKYPKDRKAIIPFLM